MHQTRVWLGLLLMLSMLSVQARDRITWAIFDWPPLYILQDHSNVEVTQLGSGMGDNMVRLLQQGLPQYEHHVVNMVPGRIFAEMRGGTHLCYASALANADRLATTTMTAAGVSPPVQVVMRKDTLQAHPQWRDGVDLPQLLHDRRLLGNYQMSRSFGDDIDKLLASPDNLGMKPMAVVNQSESLFRMLLLKRLDYTLEYPQVLVYQQRTGQVAPDLVAVPIKGAPAFLTAYVACGKNEWGRKAIADIDKALQKIAAQPSYLQAIEVWVPPEEMARRRKDYEHFVRQRATRSMIVPEQ